MNENRKKIIDAAVALIKENGYESLNVQAICRKAFVARSTFYYQFHSLDEVLSHCFKIDYVIDQSISKKINAFTNPLDKLVCFHIAYLKQTVELGFELARYQQIAQLKGLYPDRKANYLITSNSIITYIREGQEQNWIANPTPPEILAFTITKCMAGCIAQWLNEGGNYNLIKDTLETISCIYIIPQDYSWEPLLFSLRSPD